MSKQIKYTISFLPTDEDLLQFISAKKKAQSFSSYVRELIRRDMEKHELQDMEYIYEYVVTKLMENGLFSQSTESNDSISDIDKETIMNLF
ncbi:hypothetical protein [Schinkia azotoformans]|uniref:hypothetical protein n=1 Tax=Schinkia azotoformans TaxID=1454 RepID=UPI002DB6BB6B|nr:hypothetical protein [Schinkia azotoformans]MEC1759884.1 hypothetical protein [Schinkia azotoformans]